MSQALIQDGKTAYERGIYVEAAQYLRQALHEAEAKKVPEDELGELYLELGKALRETAIYAEAEDFLWRSTKILAKLHGPKSFEYSNAILELGRVYYARHELDKARAALNEAYEIRKSIFPDPHEHLAEALRYLGWLAWKDGDYTQALKFRDQALEMIKATLGDASKECAQAFADRAYIIGCLGQWDVSEVDQRKAASLLESHHGPDHPEVGRSLLNLTVALSRQERTDELESISKRVLAIFERSYGQCHPYTALTLSNLGTFCIGKGEVQEALSYLERALAINEKVLGEDNPELTHSLSTLALIYRVLNRKEEADEMGRRAEKLTQIKFAASSQKNFETLLLQAGALFGQKKLDEADVIAKQALDIAIKEYGPSTLKVAEVEAFRAAIYQTRDPQMAIDCLTNVLRIHKKHFGEKHPQVSETLHALSVVFHAKGDAITAGLLALQARTIAFNCGQEDPFRAKMTTLLKLARQAKGDSDPAVLQVMRIAAEAFHTGGRTEEAKALYQDYLKASEEQAGSDSVDFANELIALGTINVERGDGNGIELLEKALAIEERALGEDHVDLVPTIEEVSRAYLCLGNHKLSEQFARRSIALIERELGEQHWSLGHSLSRLKLLLELQKRNDEAKAVQNRLEQLPKPSPTEKTQRQQQGSDKDMKKLASLDPKLQAQYVVAKAHLVLKELKLIRANEETKAELGQTET